MQLMEKILNRKNEHHTDIGGHHHNHEHCHDEHCAYEHNHDRHGHQHGHGCDCCEDGIEIDRRKTIAGVAVFIAAFVIFHIPGLFESFGEQTRDTIELIGNC